MLKPDKPNHVLKLTFSELNMPLNMADLKVATSLQKKYSIDKIRLTKVKMMIERKDFDKSQFRLKKE